jgi:hypothetical protein
MPTKNLGFKFTSGGSPPGQRPEEMFAINEFKGCHPEPISLS